jgi:4'-phosphopantetheinyl transferase
MGSPLNSEWLHAPGDLSLNWNEIHVWRASLDMPDEHTEKLSRVLSPDERRRSEKFRFTRDRRHFIAARGTLKCILARYLGTEPGKIDFSYNKHGKPFLCDSSAVTELSFNLSHAGDLALYAFTLKRKIGVDLECYHQDIQWNEIAERFFSSSEQAGLSVLPEKDRQRIFFTYWTRKEAILKAQGTGLTADIKGINVALEPKGTPYLLSRDTSDNYVCWSLIDLCPGFGYVGALAVEGEGLSVQSWQWD